MDRGNIETRESFIKRSVGWWIPHGQYELEESPKLFSRFCKQYSILDHIDDKSIVAEVGPGPYGGIIEVLNVKCGEKVFIDYAMKELKELGLISWPSDNSRYLTCPAEHIDLPSNYVDVLLSYNCLDHGWDIWKAIKECIRVSKVCFISFDCRADLKSEFTSHSPDFYISHHQLLRSSKVKRFLEGLESNRLGIEFHVCYNQHSFPCAEFVVRKK